MEHHSADRVDAALKPSRGRFSSGCSGRTLTRKVNALVAALTVAEKIALVHQATDPASLGQAGYNPGVPRLGIPPRRDADALGINVTADATALPSHWARIDV